MKSFDWAPTDERVGPTGNIDGRSSDSEESDVETPASGPAHERAQNVSSTPSDKPTDSPAPAPAPLVKSTSSVDACARGGGQQEEEEQESISHASRKPGKNEAGDSGSSASVQVKKVGETRTVVLGSSSSPLASRASRVGSGKTLGPAKSASGWQKSRSISLFDF